jgi:ABC-type ATPase with predicted acetyltransferase domain
MSDWSLENAKITKIVDTSDFVYITGIFDTRFYDYVINTESGLVTRGYKEIKVHNIYEMLFVVNKKLASGLYKCPKCGATVKPNIDGRCDYCHTALSFTNSRIVLSKKSRIN